MERSDIGSVSGETTPYKEVKLFSGELSHKRNCSLTRGNLLVYVVLED